MTPIQKAFKENRIIRGKWTDTDSNGRQLLCLYTALLGDPEARPDSCPADLCPEWIAHLLPWIDDSGTEEHWPEVVRRVVDLAEALPHVPPETEWRVRALIVREAMRYTDDQKVLAVCEQVVDLCDRRGRGDTVSDEEMESARAAVWAAAAAAAAAATRAAAAAAAWAAGATAEAAGATAEAAAAGATARVARAAEADILIDKILDEIEVSVGIR